MVEYATGIRCYLIDRLIQNTAPILFEYQEQNKAGSMLWCLACSFKENTDVKFCAQLLPATNKLIIFQTGAKL